MTPSVHSALGSDHMGSTAPREERQIKNRKHNYFTSLFVFRKKWGKNRCCYVIRSFFMIRLQLYFPSSMDFSHRLTVSRVRVRPSELCTVSPSEVSPSLGLVTVGESPYLHKTSLSYFINNPLLSFIPMVNMRLVSYFFLFVYVYFSKAG